MNPALAYRRKGWHPIPLCRPKPSGGCWQHGACQSPGKRPLLEDWPNQINVSEEEIASWDARFGAYNIGLLMGHGTCAVDVDPRNGGDVSFESLGVPQSLRSTSPSGGWHVYVAGSWNKAQGPPGIDLIGLGGQIVAPPSIHVRTLETGEPYYWEDCEDETPDPPTVQWAPPATEVRRPASTPAPALPESEARRIGAALFQIPAEDRALWLRVGMALKTALGDGGWHLFDAWSRTTTAGNYDSFENRRQWDSLKAGDGTAGTVNEETLFWLAQQYGSEDPAPPVSSEFALDEEPFPGWVLDDMPPLMRLAYDWILRRSVRPQPILAFAGTLALFSALTSRRYGLPGVRSNLYVLSIAPTGSGKNDPRSAIKDLLIEAGLTDILGGEDIASDSGILSALNRSRVCLFQLDEIGEMLSRWTNPNAKPHERAIKTALLSLFSANGSVVLGKEYSQAGFKDKDKVPRTDLDDPCMVIHGTTTPDIWESIETRDAGRGMLARVLVFEAPPIRPAMNAIDPAARTVPPELIAGVRELRGMSVVEIIDTGSDGGGCALPPPETRMVAVLPEYVQALRELDEELNQVGRNLKLSGTWDVINRLVELAQRMALIRAVVSDPVNPVLRASDLTWGAGLARYSTSAVARRLDKSVASSKTGREANQILAFIEGRGSDGAMTSEITRAFQGIPKRERQDRLADLVEAGRVVKTTRATKGMTATVYVAATSFTERSLDASDVSPD